MEALRTAEPCIFVGFQSQGGHTYKLLTLHGSIMHSQDVYWADQGPHDPHDLNSSKFIYGFENARQWFKDNTGWEGESALHCTTSI